jgi:opacity protein-like surface antigen
MKTMIIVAAATSAVVLGGTAEAQDSGWYVRGELGSTFEGQLDANSSVDFDDGLMVGIAIGRDYLFGMRAEGELLYTDNDIKGSANGDASALGVFANLYYDFNRGGRIQPFLGAGIGMMKVDFDDGVIDDDATEFAYQAKAGVAYKINDRLTADLVYRYLQVTDLEFGTGSSKIEGDYDTQAVTVGLRYKFGS